MKTLHAGQRGLSIVELLVGLAVSLTVVAAGLLGLAYHLRESQGLLTEGRMTQDLRAVSELIARDLRRAGALNLTESTAHFTSPESPDGRAYRLRNGVIETQFGDEGWQAMTDLNTVRVTTLRLTPNTEEIPLEGFCSQPCPPGSPLCPPKQLLRSLVIDVEARGIRTDLPARRVSTTVRLRHDTLLGACPA